MSYWGYAKAISSALKGAVLGVKSKSNALLDAAEKKVDRQKLKISSDPRPVHGNGEEGRPSKRPPFEIPPWPTGIEQITHYWNAHWDFFIERLITPITDLYGWMTRALPLWQPTGEVVRPDEIKRPVAEPVKIDSEVEERYSQVFADVLEKTLLPNQDKACKQTGLIIIRSMLVAGKPVDLGTALLGLESPEDLKARLMALLPGLVQELDAKRLLKFREHAIQKISFYLTTMIPIAYDLKKGGKNEGELRKALEANNLLVEKTIGSHLARRLPGLTGRFKTEQQQKLLLWLAGLFTRKPQLIDLGLDTVSKLLFAWKAIDSHFAAMINATKKKKKPKESAQSYEKSEVLTDNEDKAIRALIKVVGGKLTGKAVEVEVLDFGPLASLVRQKIDKGLGGILGNGNHLNLTPLIPALKEAAEKAKTKRVQSGESSKVADEFFAQEKLTGLWAWLELVRVFTGMKNLRILLHEYPLLLDNLMRTLIHDAVENFL